MGAVQAEIAGRMQIAVSRAITAELGFRSDDVPDIALHERAIVVAPAVAHRKAQVDELEALAAEVRSDQAKGGAET